MPLRFRKALLPYAMHAQKCAGCALSEDLDQLLHLCSLIIVINERFKGSIFLKNRHFLIQERFNILIYGINTFIAPDSL